jgi:predicted nucleic acid-binding protein
MIEKIFVDTNILIYAHDLDAGRKHQQANAAIKRVWKAGTGVISIQVLQEFYVTITRKIHAPLPSIKLAGLSKPMPLGS